MELKIEKNNESSIVKWLLRASNNPVIKNYLLSEPYYFAVFFAAIDGKVVWPKSLNDLINNTIPSVEIQREKIQQWQESKSFPLSKDRTQSYINKFFKGVCIYTAIKDDIKIFDRAINSLIKKWNIKNNIAKSEAEESGNPEFKLNIAHMNENNITEKRESSFFTDVHIDVPDYLAINQFSSHLLILNSFLKFSKHEMNVLEMSYLLRDNDDFRMFYTCFNNKYLIKTLMKSMLNIDDELHEIICSDQNTTVLSGIISLDENTGEIQEMSDFWYEWFSIPVKTYGELLNKIAKPMSKKYNSGSLGHLSKEDKDIITQVMLSYNSSNNHVLLYSPSRIDKLGFVYQLLKENEINGYELNDKISEIDATSVCYVAQKYISSLDPLGVLVIPRAESVLKKSKKSLRNMLFFSIEISEESEESSIEKALLSYPMRMVWLTNNTDNLKDDTISRFIYTCEVKAASRSERKKEIDSLLKDSNLSDDFKNKLSQHVSLGEQQLKSAIALSTALMLPKLNSKQLKDILINPNLIIDIAQEAKSNQPEYFKSNEYKEKIILKAIEQSEKALNRKEKEYLRTSITEYSLDLLNINAGFNIEQIIKSLKINPSSSLCFFGLPGTGKTQLAEYIAVEIDKPIIKKTGSELLGKYVGETEKAIRSMFEEAKEQDAILLLDECDSFLRDRRLGSKNNWEVSMVNQLLQEMEKFNGIFICATNLMENLDIASLRRFTFKINFQPLLPEQRWKMFINEIEKNNDVLHDQDKKYLRDELDMLSLLTPGDFATVKRQSKLIGENLTPYQWLERLKFEIDIKNKMG